MPVPAVVEARHVTRSFIGPPPADALRDLTVRIEPGERVAIMGPSGSGKSTALNLLGLLDRPSYGAVLIDGRDTAGLTDRELSFLRGQSIGFVFQSFHLVPYRTVEQNVAMGMLYSAPLHAITRHRVAEVIDAVGLSHRSRAAASTLSGGEAQRVAIARALVNGPRLLLADEPTGNLDSARGREIETLLQSLGTPQTAQVIVTHDPRVAARLDRTITIEDGASS